MPKENLAMANIGAAHIIRDLLLEQGWTELPDVVDRVRGKVAYLVTSEGVKAAALAPDVRKAVKQAIQAGARKLYVHAVSDVMEPDALDAFWVGMGFRYLMDDRDGRPIYTRGITPPKASGKGAKANHHGGVHAEGDPLGVYLPPLSNRGLWLSLGKKAGLYWRHPSLFWEFRIYGHDHWNEAVRGTGEVTAGSSHDARQLARFSGDAASVHRQMRRWYASLTTADWKRVRGSKPNAKPGAHAYVAKEISYHDGPKVHLERREVEVLSGLTAYTLSPDGRVDTATAVKVSPMQYEKMAVPDLTSPQTARKFVTSRLVSVIAGAALRDRVDFNAWWQEARGRLGVVSPKDSRAALTESIAWWRKASPEAAKLLRPGLLDPLLPKIGSAAKPNGPQARDPLAQLRDRLVNRAVARILRDRHRGVLGPVRSFSGLGDFVDGNLYLLTREGAYDPEVDRLGHVGALTLLGEVIQRLDAWLRTGVLVRESTARTRPKARARR